MDDADSIVLLIESSCLCRRGRGKHPHGAKSCDRVSASPLIVAVGMLIPGVIAIIPPLHPPTAIAAVTRTVPEDRENDRETRTRKECCMARSGGINGI